MNHNMPDPLLRAHLWGNVSRQLMNSNAFTGSIDNELLKRQITYSDEFQNCLVECVWQQIEDIGKQLEILCHHRDSNDMKPKDLDTLFLLKKQ